MKSRFEQSCVDYVAARRRGDGKEAARLAALIDALEDDIRRRWGLKTYHDNNRLELAGTNK